MRLTVAPLVSLCALGIATSLLVWAGSERRRAAHRPAPRPPEPQAPPLTEMLRAQSAAGHDPRDGVTYTIPMSPEALDATIRRRREELGSLDEAWRAIGDADERWRRPGKLDAIPQLGREYALASGVVASYGDEALDRIESSYFGDAPAPAPRWVLGVLAEIGGERAAELTLRLDLSNLNRGQRRMVERLASGVSSELRTALEDAVELPAPSSPR